MSQVQANGGQPQKPPKYASIYHASFFNGLNTNRSPLRPATASHLAQKFYADSSADAMIAGLNIEVSNRLTLIRRPGNPIYSGSTDSVVHSYQNPNAFDEFRVNKSANDNFGSTLESIFTMIDEGNTTSNAQNYLYSLSSTLQRGGDASYNTGLKYAKTLVGGSSAQQTYMQPVGNTLYFANGSDNRKWLQSLFVRNSNGNNTFLQGSDGLAGTYPYGTFLLDPANGNPQEFIGTAVASVTNVQIVSNVLTLTLSFNILNSSDVNDYPIGTAFQLWGFTATNNQFLNGAVITLTQAYTHAGTLKLIAAYNHANINNAETTGLIIQTGTTPVVAETGNSVPTYSTIVAQPSNNFLGTTSGTTLASIGLTLDGNTLWQNRGNYKLPNSPSVYNWGIKAPTATPTFTLSGQAGAWQQNTYYSPASVYQDPNGNLWQVVTAGRTGSVQPTWPNPPTVFQQKILITSVSITANVATFVTDTQSPALVTGDTVVIQTLDAASFLNGQSLTVLAGGLSTTGFTANFTFTGSYGSPTAQADYGVAIKTAGTNPPTTQSDGTVTWRAIQSSASLTWAAHTHYNVGDFTIATVSGKKQFFQLGFKKQPYINGNVNVEIYTGPPGTSSGAIPFFNSGDSSPSGYTYGVAPFAIGNATIKNPAGLNWFGNTSQNLQFNTVNGAGETTGAQTDSGFYEHWSAVIYMNVFIPVAGQYTFTLAHDDGSMFAFGQAQDGTGTGVPNKVNGSFTSGWGSARTRTCKYGFQGLVGNENNGFYSGDSATWNFPIAGNYTLEIDYTNNAHRSLMVFMSPGQPLANEPTSPGTITPVQNLAFGRDISSGTTPTWPNFTTTGASWDPVLNQINWGASVTDTPGASAQYIWNNIGPVADFLWQANTQYTLAGTTIIDSNGNQEGAYETGVSGTTTPSWLSAANSITPDTNAPLKWLNEGAITAITNAGNTITALSTQGWYYWLALVNSLDNTISNVSPVSAKTGPLKNGQVTFAAGAGLTAANIDPQTDYVAIFRTTDGFTTPLLIPGYGNSPYTVSLAQYMNSGYVDTTPDVNLNNLIQGAQAGENTPPAQGAINLTFHLNRLWYSVGNNVYWTTGPLAPNGNGLNGTAPGNVASCQSLVKRLVPTAIGVLAFTISDIYIIAGNGTTNSPILPAIPYMTGVGLGNYNALDVNGGLIGFFTTDNQFVIFDPSAGLSYVGNPIGNLFRLNTGAVGKSWNPTIARVVWYVNGEDAGWFAGDGTVGWYRVIQTPAPESGSVTWSTFAQIAGGSCGAMKSVETSPGVHKLLIGQTSNSANILARSITGTTDNGATDNGGTTYNAWAVLGSLVLAQPGQLAKVMFIATDSVNTGSPLVVGVILDEALPYYAGSFDILKNWESDPTNLPQSTSILGQRFYLSEDELSAAYCRHMQIQISWPAEAAQNELQSFTIYGAYEVEA